MKTYSVAEIAKLINVNEETVRRWIRSGSLKSTMLSKKNGNVVDELALRDFIETKPKYRSKIVWTEQQYEDTYVEKLNNLLNELIKERDQLNERINKIQTLLKES